MHDADPVLVTGQLANFLSSLNYCGFIHVCMCVCVCVCGGGGGEYVCLCACMWVLTRTVITDAGNYCNRFIGHKNVTLFL